MNMDLTEDQAALVAAVQRVVNDHQEIPPGSRRGSHFYSAALDDALSKNGFIGAILEGGLTGFEAALVVEEVSRAPVVTEVAASTLVAPHVGEIALPRPIAMASGDLSKPIRFLPMARTLLFDSRSVLPSYSARKMPRRCSSGTTCAQKSSSPPGR